tara:strand:+ start:10253 stop:10879 length:627 start_codon:yes stop_codon:yes gene_type:complete
MSRSDRAEALLGLEPEQRREELRLLSHAERAALGRHWRLWAHPVQLPPSEAWHLWLIMAGRGFGKTRAGAEWVRAIAEADPTARIALVAASLGEARRVMVEGESGLLAIASPRKRPRFEPSRRQLVWPGGARATFYSAAEPESLRGPQHSHASRSGSEGVFRQRGAGEARCAGAGERTRRTRAASGRPAARRCLSGRRRCDRGMAGVG